MAPVTAGIFVEFTCWKLMAPLLPLWASRLGATPLAVGGLLTAFAAAELGCAPLLGALSDRFGRRPVIVVSLALSVASFAMVALARSLATLFAAQIVGGFGAAIVSVGQAAVADRVNPTRLAQAMAYLAAAIGIAYVVGPALGGALSALGTTAPFWAATVLAFGNTAMIWALLPETRSPDRAADPMPAAVRWRELLRPKWMHRLALTALIFGSVIVTLEAVLPLFTHRVLGWDEAPNGWLFAYLGVAIVAMQLGLVGRCATRFGERRLMLGGLATAAAGLILLGVSATVAPVLIGVGLIGVGAGTIIPLLPTLFCLASPGENRGAVLGFAQGLIALARLVGPLVATAAFTWSIGAPFIIVGLACVLGVALLTAGRNPVIDAAGALEP
ncbi:MAG TPA: MFS transporter [Mycobacterium sp.]|nr:MFS transporter [Mycobacterium sp.]